MQQLKTFDLYRLSPAYLRERIQFRLAYSVKQLLDAWPLDAFNDSIADAESFFERLLSLHSDPCDFALQHCLVRHLLVDEFEEARLILGLGASRSPEVDIAIRDFSEIALGHDFPWYQKVFSIHDYPGGLQLVAPTEHQSLQAAGSLHQAMQIIEIASPEAYAELTAFRPQLLLATVPEGAPVSFGGFSSNLAWGAVLLNAAPVGMMHYLIQLVHELAHQLLFALAVEVPLVYNDPQDLFSSPVRKDPRPMDGILHACFVGARLYEVLDQIQCSPVFAELSVSEQHLLAGEMVRSVDVVNEGVSVIDRSALLSALGERVVKVTREAVALA